jgi:hypothetical protein
MHKNYIFGNNLSALVAALECGRKGQKVVLLNPTPNWGAHFGGLRTGADNYDIGRIVCDFFAYNYDTNNPDLRTYTTQIRNDVGRFLGTIQTYIQQFTGVHQITCPQMYYEGHYTEDTYQADSLACIHLLSTSQKIQMREELLAILANPNLALHASQKKYSKTYLENDYRTISLANHGATFHEAFVEPVLQKTLGAHSGELLGLFHRLPWLPLYYPETLLAALENRPHVVKVVPFHYPNLHSFTDLITILMGEIKKHPNIEIKQQTSDFQALIKQKVQTKEPFVWTLSMAELLKYLKDVAPIPVFLEEKKLEMSIAFLKIPNTQVLQNFSSLGIVDTNLFAYRVTNQTHSNQIESAESQFCIEYGTEILAKNNIATPAAIQAYSLQLLKEIKTIAANAEPTHTHSISIKGLRIPNKANLDIFEAQYSFLQTNFPFIHLAGLSSGFATGSMNDQLVQGLQIAALF